MPPLRAFAKLFMASLHGAVRVLIWIVTWPLSWLSHLRVDLWSVAGEEQSSHLPLSILCAVSDEGTDRNYVLRLIFGDSCRQHCLGRYWLWNLGKAISAASDHSMIVAQLGESHLRFARAGDWFFIPTWLLGEVDLPRDAQANRKVSGDLRRIRRHELQGEITRDPQQFEDFYHNMHVPYAVQRFGDCADFGSCQRLRRQFQHSDLLLIKNRERSIAGQLIMYGRHNPYLWDMGIRDGNQEYVRAGACCALYHFGLQHLQNQGYKKAFLGLSRPFLCDGILQFKKKWSQRIVGGNSEGFALKVLSPTPAAKAFLCKNPFIFKQRGVLNAAVFLDADRPPSEEGIREIDNDYFHAGLSRLFVYCLRQEGAPQPNRPSAELSQRIELHSARDLG